ncbi:MAG: DUF2834 domain-containing protein [Cyanobacteria bacterium P01_D01_bin.105]
MRLNNAAFAFLWLGFVLYAFTLSPPAQPDTFDLIVKLSSGQWEGLNPLVVTLFNLMGIWPMVYACLALIDGKDQSISAWPFVAFSFGVGAFALLPYLALRVHHPINHLGEKNLAQKNLAQKSSLAVGEKDPLLKVVDSPWTGRLLLLGALALVGYGVADGHWMANEADFAQQWQTSQFIHVMSLDFCMLCAVVSPLIKSDMAKRGMENSLLYWMGALVPLFGVLVYLSVRSPLSLNNEPKLDDTPDITLEKPEDDKTAVSA